MCRAGFACCLLLGIDLGSKLSAVALAKLWDNFPCRALVQSIFLQKSHNELKFNPWKHITSEVQADREKQVCQKKEKKLLDILALAAGQVDLPECELPSGSPYVIHSFFEGYLLRPCWLVPLGVCQIVNFEIYGTLCSSWVGGLGSARPNRTRGGNSRCGSAPAAGFRWIKRGKGKDGKGKKGTVQRCHAFQAGKCTYDKCRFAHEYEHCVSKTMAGRPAPTLPTSRDSSSFLAACSGVRS